MTRKSGIELLRIIAMLLIVAHHFAVAPSWSDANFGFNFYWLKILASFGRISVGIFFVICGYFAYNKKCFKWQRIFKILRPTWFYSIMFFILAVVTYFTNINLTLPLQGVVIQSFFPLLSSPYWFVSEYVAINLLLPYLKRWFDALGDRDFLKCLGLLVIFSILPNLILTPLTGNTFSMISFPCSLIYATIGYGIHRFEQTIYKYKGVVGVSSILALAAIAVGPFIIRTFNNIGFENFPGNFFWEVNSLPCLILASAAFIFFNSLQFQSKIINYIADLTFGVYLIHENPIVRDWLWSGRGILQVTSHLADGKLHFVCYSALIILCIFALCLIIECIRKTLLFIFKKIFTKNVPHTHAQ